MSKWHRSKKRTRPERSAAEEAHRLEAKIAALPATARSHISARDLEKGYFPTDRIIIHDENLASWKASPLESIELLGEVCQALVAAQRVGVCEIRLPVPIPWVQLLSALIHRRTAKVASSGDKFLPRSRDYYRVVPDQPANAHQAIRFFSSCFCGGCLEFQHRPKVLVYFDVAAASSPNVLARSIDIPLNTMPAVNGQFRSKIPEHLTQDHMISRFFINVQVPHHRACRRTMPTVVASWSKAYRAPWLANLRFLEPVEHHSYAEEAPPMTPSSFLTWIQQHIPIIVEDDPAADVDAVVAPTASSSSSDTTTPDVSSSLQVPVITDYFTQFSWGLGSDGCITTVTDNEFPTSPSSTSPYDDDDSSTTSVAVLPSSPNKRRCLNSLPEEGIHHYYDYHSCPLEQQQRDMVLLWDHDDEMFEKISEFDKDDAFSSSTTMLSF